MRSWRINRRMVLGGVFALFLSTVGIFVVLAEFSPPEPAQSSNNLWSLSESAPQAVVQNVIAGNTLETFEARVTSVPSGEILIVVDKFNQQHQVRLLGIDVPGLTDDYGREARENLESLVKGRSVRVTPQKMQKSVLLGKVVRDGTNIAVEQIRAGLARFDRGAPDLADTDRRLYAEMEAYARHAGLGMWFGVKPTHAADPEIVAHQSRPASRAGESSTEKLPREISYTQAK